MKAIRLSCSAVLSTLLIAGSAATLVLSCAGDSDSGNTSSAVGGCTVACRLPLECLLKQDDAASECEQMCKQSVADVPKDCDLALSALGDCAGQPTCDELLGGSCSEEFERVQSACEEMSLGAGADDDSSDDTADDAAQSCSRFEFEVTGESCGESCAAISCECDPFPTSITACTPDGCIVGANCDAVCAADSLADVFDCDHTYTGPGISQMGDPQQSSDTSDSEPDATCQPQSCEEQGKNCGTIDDGCGESLSCGFCSPPDSCGASEDNVCGCVPRSCDSVGAECGEIEDGCGGSVDCGQCQGTNSCGATGQDNKCGCSPDGIAIGSAQSGVNVPGIGEAEWKTPDNLDAVDGGSSSDRRGTAHTSLSNGGGPITQWLVASDFGLNVPPAASIDGIELTIRKRAWSLPNVADNALRLVQGGSILDQDRAQPEDWGTGTGTVATYGGATDLWQTAWTPADVNDPSFGVALSAKYTTTAGNSNAYVDHVEMKVYYSVDCQN